MILTKEQFVEYINILLDFEDKETEMQRKYGICIGELTDAMVTGYRELLEYCMGDEYHEVVGTTISWWLYETNIRSNFGAAPEIYDLNGTVVCSLDTAEDLYDYLAQMRAE